MELENLRKVQGLASERTDLMRKRDGWAGDTTNNTLRAMVGESWNVVISEHTRALFKTLVLADLDQQIAAIDQELRDLGVTL
jgi:hypothetical protein